MTKIPGPKEGDLVRVCSPDGGHWTLCIQHKKGLPSLTEMPKKRFEVFSDPRYENIFEWIEGKLALVVYVSRNKLEQAIGYRVLIEGHEVFCKAIVGNKYFKLVGNQGDESR
jgi:hypothetical protein